VGFAPFTGLGIQQSMLLPLVFTLCISPLVDLCTLAAHIINRGGHHVLEAYVSSTITFAISEIQNQHYVRWLDCIEGATYFPANCCSQYGQISMV
jgi:hypothetical protein